MANVALSNLHPDLRLGLLLVVAALLLGRGMSSGPDWALLAAPWPDLTPMHFGLFAASSGLGALFVVAAAIRVDRRPPHGMMAAEALVLALSLALMTLFHGFWVALAGMFLAGASGASVGSLIFYSVAVKGYTRYRGALTGALAMGFNMNWGAGAIGAFCLLFGLTWGGWAIADEAAGVLIGSSAVILVLAGGISLLLLLPRWFTGTYEPGPTLRETVAVPGAKIQIIWVAAVYLVAAMILSVVWVLVWRVNMEVAQDFPIPEFAFQALALTGGTGALLWGI